MATEIKIDMAKFKQALVDRVRASGNTLAQLRNVHAAVVAGTETQAQGDAAARMVALAWFAACEPHDEPVGRAGATYIEDRVTGQVVLKP